MGCTDYDSGNQGLRFVYDLFWNKIVKAGIVSNVIATCGKELKLYVERYASKVATTPESKMVFVELDQDRYRELLDIRTTLPNEVRDRVHILQGDVQSSAHLVGYPLKQKYARVEDLGLGIRMDMVFKTVATPRLYLQSGAINPRNFLRAQIVSGSRRQVPDEASLMALKKHFSVLNARIASINDLPVGSNVLEFSFSQSESPFNEGAKIASYKFQDQKCYVYKHSVKLDPKGRIETVLLYEHKNGGSLFDCLIIYR